MLVRMIGTLGRWGIGWLRLAGGMAELVQGTMRYLLRWATRRAHLPRDAVVYQMVRVGVRSVPIVLITNLFVGMILAVSIADLLRQYGQLMALPNIIGVAITRELAPLMTAIVMSGFVGAAMAAELGTMKVSEEILALETSAVSPLRYLVLPRLLAVMAMLACLTIFADYAGIGGGYLIGAGLLHIPGPQYLEATRQAIYWRDILLNGLVKSEVFAVIITVVACYQGLRVTGGAEGVGRATTDAVVHSIVLLIAANLVLAVLFNWVMVESYW